MARTLFNYEENRLDYGGLLMPDVGYDVEFAVAFTYSLDLEALLGVSVSMGLLDDMDTGFIENPFYMLETIRKSSDKLAIFCNMGSIALPRNIKSVFTLLENSVFEVKLSGMKNFHSKMWFIKYTSSDGSPQIKLIVLSGNLTFDSSFDYAVELTGSVGRRKLNKNLPLSEMLKFAAGSANPQKRKKILALAEEILYVTKFDLDDRFESYEFIPLGLSTGTSEQTMLGSKHKDFIAFSPFLSGDIVKTLAENAKRRATLFTRKSSLTKEIISLFDEVYIVKDAVLDNEITAADEQKNPQGKVRQGCDIHAKLYFTHGEDGNHLYIGSANAAHKAFYENMEFLLKLKFRPYMMGHEYMLKDFLPDEGCPFELITDIEADEPQPDTLSLDKAFREAIKSIKGAEVAAQGERFNLTVYTDNKPQNTGAVIAPLFRPDCFATLDNGLVFSDMLLRELSKFFILRMEDKQAVIKIAVKGMPEGRDQAIYKSIIRDKNGFLAYVCHSYSPITILKAVLSRQNLKNAL